METKHKCSRCGTGWNADVNECPECVWQVHVIGVDDVHPAGSMRDAQEQAHAINVATLVGTSDGSPHYPFVWAVPRLATVRESTPAPTEALVIAAARVEHEMRICAEMNGGGAEEDWADVLAEGLAASVAARTAPASEVAPTNAEALSLAVLAFADQCERPLDGTLMPPQVFHPDVKPFADGVLRGVASNLRRIVSDQQA